MKFIDNLSDWSGKLFAWLIIPLVATLVYEVIARYVFNNPTVWAYDMTYLLSGTFFMMGVAQTLRHGAHVRVDVFYQMLSPRGKAIVETCLYLLVFFPLVGVLLVKGIQYAQASWAIKETAWLSSWRPPIYHFKTVIPLAAFLMLLQGGVDFIRNLVVAVRGKQLGN